MGLTERWRRLKRLRRLKRTADCSNRLGRRLYQALAAGRMGADISIVLLTSLLRSPRNAHSVHAGYTGTRDLGAG
jgi:hypothetical protein